MLREAVANANLAVWAQAGLLIFFVVFCALVARAVFQKKEDVEALKNLPLENDESPSRLTQEDESPTSKGEML